MNKIGSQRQTDDPTELLFKSNAREQGFFFYPHKN